MLGLTAEAITPSGTLLPVFGVVGILGFAIILMISIRGKIARRNSERPSPRELIEQLKAPLARGGHDGRRLDVIGGGAELVETAQRLGAQLDNKARRLETLIEQADRRIASLSGSPVTPSTSSAASEPAAPTVAAPVEPGPDPLTKAVYAQADAGRTSTEIARELDEQVGKVELILALRE